MNAESFDEFLHKIRYLIYSLAVHVLLLANRESTHKPNGSSMHVTQLYDGVKCFLNKVKYSEYLINETVFRKFQYLFFPQKCAKELK